MELAYTPEEQAFRDEVRSFIRDNLPADIQDKVLNGKKMGREDFLRWHRLLHKQGWVAPNWLGLVRKASTCSQAPSKDWVSTASKSRTRSSSRCRSSLSILTPWQRR